MFFPADADEVTQIVLVKLTDKMRHFRYDPGGSFRAWLRTVTVHAWNDFLDAQRGRASGDSRIQNLLQMLEARTDLHQHLEANYDHELLTEAMERVQRRVAVQTWEAFRLTALDGKTGSAAAQLLHMPVAHVYVAKSRVQRLLQEEIQKLEKPTTRQKAKPR